MWKDYDYIDQKIIAVFKNGDERKLDKKMLPILEATETVRYVYNAEAGNIILDNERSVEWFDHYVPA